MPDDQNTNAVQDNTATANSEVTTTTTENTTTTSKEGAGATTTDTQTNDAKQAETQQEQPTGAPEQYADFTLAENVTVVPELMDEFKTLAKESNLPQEAAQKLVDFAPKFAQQIQAAQEAERQKTVEAWVKESETKHGKEGIEAANKALSRFITPEFVSFLAESGLGNHPQMIGVFRQINEAISESKFVDSTRGGGEKSAAAILYPNMKI